MKKEDWEKWIDNLMGEKLYEGSTDFTATHIKDFISQLLKEQRKELLKEIKKAGDDVPKGHFLPPSEQNMYLSQVAIAIGNKINEMLKSLNS